jgi:hypothetical protein
MSYSEYEDPAVMICKMCINRQLTDEELHEFANLGVMLESNENYAKKFIFETQKEYRHFNYLKNKGQEKPVSCLEMLSLLRERTNEQLQKTADECVEIPLIPEYTKEFDNKQAHNTDLLKRIAEIKSKLP